MNPDHDVIIIGGGWAGLAAALELDAHGIPVTLFESAPQLGGRARNAPFGTYTVDNGQHLLIGAYRETLRLLAMTGTDESEVMLRTRLRLQVLEGNEALLMQPPPLPAPLHLAWAQLMAGGLGLGERLRALGMSLRLMLNGFTLKQDISVAELLQKHGQDEKITRRFWEPLCIATLNTPMSRASARVFLRVLRDSFTRSRHDADLLIPTVPLGELFPQRAASHIETHKGSIHLRHRCEALQLKGKSLDSIKISGKTINCRDAIIATNPRATVRLLDGHTELDSIKSQIIQLGSQPIVTVYLQYPESHRLDSPMVGLSGTLSQWVFDRCYCDQPGLFSVVISAEGEHGCWDNQRLAAKVSEELAQQFPHWPQPLDNRVIREKQATFDCSVGVEEQRPGNATPVEGLWLAGDYTDTGYPATLEGAVRSGVKCARKIIARRGQ